MEKIMNTSLMQSRLITLPSGQIVGHPVTRRELKRQTRQARLQRRAAFRQAKRDERSQ